MTETRERFASLLLEAEKKGKRDTENRKRAHRIRCAGLRNEDVRNRIAMGIKTTALLILQCGLQERSGLLRSERGHIQSAFIWMYLVRQDFLALPISSHPSYLS